MARITLTNVTKSWGDTQVLQPMSLDIADGEFVAILGPSGCGKSTTLLLLAGLYAASSGEIAFDGHAVNRVDARDRNVGVVFQSYALYPNLTVRDNIAFPLRFQKVATPEAMQRVEEAAAQVQITRLLDRKPAQLSGGQQQRVALARALVKRPNILLLDEPLSNLDATLRIAMRSELKAIQKRLGMTTLLVTHDQVEAITMADRIICMNEGRIVQIGTPEDLYRRPADLFVAGFIGSPPMTQLAAEADGMTLQLGDRSLPLSRPLSGPVTLGLRPEDIRLGQGRFAARVTMIEPLGREVFYQLDSDIGPLHALEPGEHPRFAPGEALRFDISAEHALLFDAGGRRIAGTTVPAAAPLHA